MKRLICQLKIHLLILKENILTLIKTEFYNLFSSKEEADIMFAMLSSSDFLRFCNERESAIHLISLDQIQKIKRIGFFKISVFSEDFCI